MLFTPPLMARMSWLSMDHSTSPASKLPLQVGSPMLIPPSPSPVFQSIPLVSVQTTLTVPALSPVVDMKSDRSLTEFSMLPQPHTATSTSVAAGSDEEL